MNKTNSQKLFVHFGIVAVCIVIAFFAYSCKKDAKSNANAPVALSPAVAQAKSWYDNLYPKKKTGSLAINDNGSGNLDLSQLASPDWNDPAMYARFDDDVIEMPLDSASKLGIGLTNTSSGPAMYGANYSRSSFLLLKKFDKYSAYIMTVLADPAYLEGDLTKLDHNKYNKRDSDFSGAVLYFTPNGAFVNGWFYHDGAIAGQMLTKDASADSVTSAPGKTVQNIKTNKIVTVLVCTDWYSVSYVNGKEVSRAYTNTTCVKQQQDDGTIDNILGGGSGGGTSSGAGSGSGSGNTTTKSVDCTVSPAGASYSKTSINSLKVQKVNPADGGGFPPPTGNVPCPPQTVTNHITDDDCLRHKVDEAIAKNITFNLGESMISIFNTNTDFNLNYFDAPGTSFSPSTVDGITHTDHESSQIISGRSIITSMDVSITLNQSGLQNASQEYVTATIMHEAFHAYLTYTHTLLNQHLDMARNYFSTMSAQLKAIYPNLSQTDADALTWGGLEVDALSTYSSLSQTEKNNIEITNKNYKSGKSGIPCP
jgi:hypothetical protein